jgi:ribosomal-protein-alanine acetyltransferase
MRVRRATRTDIPAMVELDCESPTSANWSHAHYESLFRAIAPELSRNLVLGVEEPSESKSVAASAATPPMVAYVAANCVDGDWDLQYIVVAKKFRRRRLATLLLNELIAHARSMNGKRIFLEVRESNQSARALYRKAGFRETGTRKGYYACPAEDAILYGRGLS